MSGFRQMSLGIISALVSVAIIFGSLMMAFVETGARMAMPPSVTPLPPSPAPPTATPIPGMPTVIPVSETPLPSQTFTITPTPPCTPPKGWTAYVVQPGDTLESLAETYNTTVKKLMTANCLLTSDLIPGTLLYVPSMAPTATATPTATEYDCGKPYGWVLYTVKSGDTLYSISVTFGTTVAALQQANCMGSSTEIWVGQQINVPYYATSTPWISPTPVPSLIPTFLPTLVPTLTGTPEYPSTPTPVPTPTYTFPDTPTPGPTTPTPQPSVMPTLPPELPTLFPTLPGTPLPTFEPDPTMAEPIPY